MPDANGNFRGMRVNAEAWERIFGAREVPPVEHRPRLGGTRRCFEDDACKARDCLLCFGTGIVQ